MTSPQPLQQGRTLAELEQLLRSAGARLLGAAETRALRVTDVVQDSRRVTPGALFVARAGTATTGARYVEEARSRGAVAVLSEPGSVASEPRLEVDDLALGWALAAHEVFGRPSEVLPVVGVTGTNGKTTVACLLEHALAELGGRPARLGTLGFFLAGEKRSETLTTPQADDLARHLAEAARAGASHLVMEVSSHALAQGRALGVRFAVAAFTNLTQDHLDFHGTLDAYAAAKGKLFTELSPEQRVLNVDDPWGARWAEESAEPSRDLRVSSKPGGEGDITVEELDASATGLRALVRVRGERVELSSRLVGAHNLENLLVALGCLVALGYPADRAARALGGAPGAPGRLERCDGEGDDVVVLVDYAHTPDALERCLQAVRALGARVTCVFGCGGDRDRSKRPLMGEAAVRHAARVVVTSDNPRTEDPERIIDDIRPGLASAPEGVEIAIEPDRSRAIERAILEAAPGEIVVLAGKGHETYQILGDRVIDFDDRVVARGVLETRRARTARASTGEEAAP